MNNTMNSQITLSSLFLILIIAVAWTRENQTSRLPLDQREKELRNLSETVKELEAEAEKLEIIAQELATNFTKRNVKPTTPRNSILDDFMEPMEMTEEAP